MKLYLVPTLFRTLLASTLCVSIGASTTLAETLKIISSLPRTGSANTQTTTMVNAIRMAIEERGAKAGGFDIAYEDWDNASPERGNWDPAIESANADKAVKDPSVVAAIGYNSGATKISLPKYNAVSISQLGFSTWPGLTKPGLGEANEPKIYQPSGVPSFFRLVPADDLQGSVGARWAKSLGATKVYILHDKELYGKGIASIFDKTAQEIGMTVLGNEGIDPKASNYRSLATKIKAANPDLVYFGGLTQTNGGQIVKDLKMVGVKAKFMAPDGCYEQAFIDAAGKENAEGNVYVTFGGLPADKLTGKGALFYNKYKEKFKAEPEAYASYAYETTMVVLDAIETAKSSDRTKIRAAIAQTKNYNGILGTWSLDANGDTTSTIMSGNIARGGRFEFLSSLN
jgi:branched-chain amino acid transport system substrate-binding protein